MRDIGKVSDALKGQDELIHLACISNDPSFDLDPALGRSINLDSFLPIINSAKESSIRKFIYASSSSVYGVKDEDYVTEDLYLEPLTDYSKFKAECEKILLNEVDSEFTSVIARPATVCGLGSRQRFDLVVNILTAHAVVNREIRVFGGGQYRPNLHIEDMVDAYLALLDAPDGDIHREIFNIGGKNLTLDEIAQAVQQVIGGDIPIHHFETNDLRSYRIDSSKIQKRINFVPKRTVYDAVSDLKKSFESGEFKDPLTNSEYTNILKMKELNLG
jgi:nucleoside-diphosphate-sugar epimerase